MKKAIQWGLVGALAASGVLIFACGGGGGESGPPNTGSASATQAPTAPASSASTVATASATATETTPPPPPPAPPLTIVAMKATFTQKAKAHTLELKADGSLVADGKPVGKITAAEMDDGSGQAMVSVNGDGTLKIAGQTNTSNVAKFDDKDAITVNGATIISIADDGTVTLVDKDGKPDKSMKVKFTGFKPTARRTAAVIIFGMFIPTKMTSTVSISSATPAVSAAPAKK